MRYWAVWVGSTIFLTCIFRIIAADKPGQLPLVPNVDGRVPLFPAGEEFREIPVDSSIEAPTSVKPASQRRPGKSIWRRLFDDFGQTDSTTSGEQIPTFRLDAPKPIARLVLVPPQDADENKVIGGLTLIADWLDEMLQNSIGLLQWFSPESYQLLLLPKTF